MRISHRHRFVFFASPKTGSSSVRRLLDPYTDVFPVLNYGLVTSENPFYPHMTPRETRDLFRRFGWDFEGYRKFTFVRSPWSRLVSLYEHIRRGVPDLEPFSSWLETVSPEGAGGGGALEQRWRRYGAYSLDSYVSDEGGAWLVDRVIRLEDIDRELLPYLAELGLPISQGERILHRNDGGITDYTSYYTDESIRLVERLYREDIERFGYRFGAPL